MKERISKERWRVMSDLDVVIIQCPRCEQESCLCSLKGPLRDGHSGHSVNAEGEVNPSIVCPHSGCDWHVWGILEGWDRGATA